MNISEQSAAALKEALDDEYKAQATYRAVIEKFGEVRPFINIVESEGRHIAALLSLFDRYGLEAPPDRWAGRVEAPESLTAACAHGVEAEIENDAMYARFFATVEEPDIRAVFERLQSASNNNHLPAFRRGLERENGAPGDGGGGRRRRGRHGRR